MLDLGIDIGGTYIKYALVSKDHKILKKWKKETLLFSNADAFYDYICQDLYVNEVEFIGVSAPGVISKDSLVLSKAAPNVRIMYQTNINAEIKKRLNRDVASLNDAKSAAYCEWSIGNGKGTHSSAYFIIGTGVGGCICNEQGIIHGYDSIAGEFSHIPVGYCLDRENKTLGLSHIASMSALIEIYNAAVDQKKQVIYGKDICDLYLNHDLQAQKAIEQWCKNIIMGLYIIMIIYNPEVICIGGGISQEDWFIDKIKDMMDNHIENSLKNLISTRIERCLYHNDANILGAIMYARGGVKDVFSK